MTVERTVVRSGREGDAVARITLDGPSSRNALALETFGELAAAVRAADADRDVRAIVLTGAGPGFCSGLDLRVAPTLHDLAVEDMVAIQQAAADAVIAICRTSTPIVAAVNGPAAGAGFSLALAADIRVAAEEATFNAAFVRIGFTGGDCGSSWLLPRAVGMSRASEILLTGRMVDAAEAERIGLVSRVVARQELDAAVAETVGLLTRNSPLGVALTKRVVWTNVDAPSLEAAIELENRNQALASRSTAFPEALAAFLAERRHP